LPSGRSRFEPIPPFLRPIEPLLLDDSVSEIMWQPRWLVVVRR
jgi:hypothetical protein